MARQPVSPGGLTMSGDACACAAQNAFSSEPEQRSAGATARPCFFVSSAGSRPPAVTTVERSARS